ncbi:hypothetical protein, partial [Bradyrhizobium sp. 23AC]
GTSIDLFGIFDIKSPQLGSGSSASPMGQNQQLCLSQGLVRFESQFDRSKKQQRSTQLAEIEDCETLMRSCPYDSKP